MFENIGGKIKGLAIINFAIGIITAFGVSIYLISFRAFRYNYNPGIWGLLLGIVCFFVSLFTSWLIYGFGELIESTQETNRLLRTGFSKDIAQEEEKRREEVVAQEKARRELVEQKELAKAAKQARIDAYWEEHEQEKQLLEEKREQAESALQAGGISTAKQEELRDLISAIDSEFEKER